MPAPSSSASQAPLLLLRLAQLRRATRSVGPDRRPRLLLFTQGGCRRPARRAASCRSQSSANKGAHVPVPAEVEVQVGQAHHDRRGLLTRSGCHPGQFGAQRPLKADRAVQGRIGVRLKAVRPSWPRSRTTRGSTAGVAPVKAAALNMVRKESGRNERLAIEGQDQVRNQTAQRHPERPDTRGLRRGRCVRRAPASAHPNAPYARQRHHWRARWGGDSGRHGPAD